MKISGVIFFVWMFGFCSGREQVEQTGVKKEVVPSPGGTGADIKSNDVVGRWESTDCADRSYPRLLSIFDGGEFALEDHIAPCPDGMICVWSGIVIYGGKWKMEKGGALMLEYLTQQEGGGGFLTKPREGLPKRFEVKIQPDGFYLVAANGEDKGCIYLKR